MRAENYARSIGKGNKVRWDRIERSAFADYPSVLDPHAVTKRNKEDVKKRTLVGKILVVPMALFAVVTFGAPIWAFALSSGVGGRFTSMPSKTDPNVVMVISGIGFVITFLVLTSLVVDWIRKRFPVSGFISGFSIICFFLALFAFGGLSADRDDVEPMVFTFAVAAALAVGVLGFIFGMVLFVMRLREGAKSGALSFSDADELLRRRRSVASLPADIQIAIRADIDRAVNELEQRGLISVAERDRALDVELGALALSMKHAPVSRR